MNYLIVVWLIGFLIFLHELGHFLAARWVKIPVSRFSVGLGPKLWGIKRKETEYRVSMIPIGGYVLPAVKDQHEFFQVPIRKRVVFAIGGPLANIVVPVVLFGVLNVMASGFTFAGVFIKPVVQTLSMFYEIVSVIPSLFVQQEQLSGIVGIIAQGGQYVGTSTIRLLKFSIMLSLNLAIFNLLPLPPLDGGRLVLCLLEKISPRCLRFHVPVAVTGWVLIIGLMAYATVLDLGRFAK